MIARADGAAHVVTMRAAWRGPLAVLMTPGDDAALIAALDAGADEALPDSASDALIAARIEALLRRERGIIRIGSLIIDTVDHHVARGSRRIDLLPREYRLLMELVHGAGRTIDRATLLKHVWGLDFHPGTNVVEVHMSRLRARIDRDFAVPLIRTERYRGYRLVSDTTPWDIPGDSAIAAVPARG